MVWIWEKIRFLKTSCRIPWNAQGRPLCKTRGKEDPSKLPASVSYGTEHLLGYSRFSVLWAQHRGTHGFSVSVATRTLLLSHRSERLLPASLSYDTVCLLNFLCIRVTPYTGTLMTSLTQLKSLTRSISLTYRGEDNIIWPSLFLRYSSLGLAQCFSYKAALLRE